MKFFILKICLKTEGFPPVHAQYLVNQEEKNFLESYLKKDFFFQIREDDYVLNCSNDTLEFEFEESIDKINAFKKLYKNNFILLFFSNSKFDLFYFVFKIFRCIKHYRINMAW